MEHNFQERQYENKTFLLICKSKDIVESRAKNIFFDDELQVAVFRVKGQLFALSNICLHQHAAVLCDGYLDELTVTCPLHGWVYSLESGQAIGSPAHLQTYQIMEENGNIYLEKPVVKTPKWMENF